MVTKTMQLARTVFILNNIKYESWRLYNDKIKNGRSLKVYGWSKQHYLQLQDLLLKVGIQSKLISVNRAFPYTPESRRYQLRLHVYE